jgi:hypothetical protein
MPQAFGPGLHLAHSQAWQIRAFDASSATEILNASGDRTAFEHAGLPQAKARGKRTLNLNQNFTQRSAPLTAIWNRTVSSTGE